MSEDEHSPPPPTMNNLQGASPDDTIKIMLATDNHIGYMERDPIRGQDSINTFKEILQLAVKHDVDFILLAGDLFHENKPSRDCIYKVIALLREYTLGDKPVQVELLSDPDEGKADGFSFPAVNYEDPNFNVAIPVFSIHGNHDDPQGAGAVRVALSISSTAPDEVLRVSLVQAGALCALDLLSVSGLINYMGKIDLPLSVSEAEAQNTGIAVRPVLLRKGITQLGMYGIGNVKDQRMHFELRSNRVRMFMPKDKDDWFNILLLHQNRVKHGPQEFVPEGMFDDSVDLVIWGHEHDCRITPEPVAGKKYYISQPGSSVATSLADGESIEKHVGLVEIHGKEFKLTPLPLRTVRPFVIEEVVLEDIAEESSLDLNDQMSITKFLKAKVNELIEHANQQWEERNARAIDDGEPELPKMLPLIRLKVDTTGVTETSNPVRFGQEFTGRIANPRDVLVFHRAKKAGGARSGKTKVAIDQPELSIDDPDLSISEKLAKVRVGTLVKEYLAAQELQVIGEGGMSDAIRVFVEKEDIHAIQTHVGQSLKKLMKNVQPSEDAELPEDELEDMLFKAKEQQDKEYLEKAKNKATSKSKGKAKAADEDDDESDDSMKMDIDTGGMMGNSDFEELDDDDEPPAKKAKATKGKAKATTTKPKPKAAPKAAAKKAAPAKAKGKGKKKVADSEEDEDEVIEIDDDDDDDVEEVPKPTKKTNRAAVLSQPAKKPPAKKTAKASASKPSAQSQLTFAPARSSRAAATKARGRMVVDDDDDD